MGLNTTPFSLVYKSFLSKITDDMYLEITKLETEALMEEFLVSAIYSFEFPRVSLTNYTLASEESEGCFNVVLSGEEINIIATYMVVEWYGQQLSNVALTRMQYTGSDFKLTSQANHLDKLKSAKKTYEDKGFKLQRLYKRRKADSKGLMQSTMSELMGGGE